jgi:hypothetical protein
MHATMELKQLDLWMGSLHCNTLVTLPLGKVATEDRKLLRPDSRYTSPTRISDKVIAPPDVETITIVAGIVDAGPAGKETLNRPVASATDL